MKAYQLSLWKFREHEGDDNQSFYAALAVQEFMQAGEPIPEELMPSVKHAFNALLSREGNVTSSLSTKEKWKERVEDVYLLVSRAGYTVQDAIGHVSRINSIAESSLKKEYYTLKKEGRKELDLSDAANRLVVKKY